MGCKENDDSFFSYNWNLKEGWQVDYQNKHFDVKHLKYFPAWWRIWRNNDGWEVY